MSVSLTCPFCRSPISVPEVPTARRTPCPHCGESVPVSAAAEAAPPPDRPAPPPATKRSPNYLLISFALTALVVAGLAAWYSLGPKPPAPPPPPPPAPPATLPPRVLGGLKYVPKDSQVVAAVQPAVLAQYADRTGQNARTLLGDFGVPVTLLDQLNAAGIPFELIQSIVIAANVDDLRLVIVLSLRQPPDKARLWESLKVTGRNPLSVELAGLPLAMTEVTDTTFLFALNEKDLATATAPNAGYEAFRIGLRESIDRISPAAFAWAATDTKDWANLPVLKLLPAGVLPAGLLERLNGVRAAAAGVSLEPELQFGFGVRLNDSTVAGQLAGSFRDRLADLKATTTADGEWATAEVSLDPPTEMLPKFKAALRK